MNKASLAFALFVATLVCACGEIRPGSLPPSAPGERCVTYEDPIRAISWSTDGSSVVVVTSSTGVEPRLDEIWVLDTDVWATRRVAEGAIGGGAALGPDRTLAWVSAGQTVGAAELWSKVGDGPATRMHTGRLNEVFATTGGLIISEDLDDLETAYRLIDGTAQMELLRVSPPPGATWVSSDGKFIVTLRPSSNGALGILQVWSTDARVDHPAPVPLYLVGMTPDRTSILFGPLDDDTSLSALAIDGGAIQSIPFGRPFNSMAVSDTGIVAYAGPLGGAASSQLCILHQPLGFD